MTRRFNGKALVDELTERLWDTSTTNRARVIRWINQIMNDIASDKPLPYYKFRLKKLLPTEQEIINMNIDIPSAPTTAISSGGSLTEDSAYKAYVSYIVYDEDQRKYMESEISPAGTERTATATDKTLDLTDIPTFQGTSTYAPTIIHRRIYLATKASGGSYGEPFFVQDIEDNTTTTLSITSEPTSTRTPVSAPQIEHLSSNDPFFLESGRALYREDMDDTRRWNPQYSESDTPYAFDYKDNESIILYPRLTSSATTAQRTITYYVQRYPHEVFYDVDCQVDLPLQFEKALIEGVIWKGYEYKDRDGKESKLTNYQQLKKEAQNKILRNLNRPSIVRDVTGDTYGFVVE